LPGGAATSSTASSLLEGNSSGQTMRSSAGPRWSHDLGRPAADGLHRADPTSQPEPGYGNALSAQLAPLVETLNVVLLRDISRR
jgi:hypothetical protein